MWKSGGRPMSFKGGNFSFRALTVQNWLRMGKYGTYLEFNTSQEAPKHCPTLDSPTQCFASAHFRSPPVRLQFASSSPPISLRLRFRLPPYSITDFSPNWNGFLSKLEAQRNWRRSEIGGELEATQNEHLQSTEWVNRGLGSA